MALKVRITVHLDICENPFADFLLLFSSQHQEDQFFHKVEYFEMTCCNEEAQLPMAILGEPIKGFEPALPPIK